MYEEMKTWRQDLHRIPEIGLEEFETSQYIKSKLSEFKIEFKEGYANTGIVARIKGSLGNSDRSIGLELILMHCQCLKKMTLIINQQKKE